MIAEIDGVPIDNPFNFRETTPELFSYEAVENNPFGTPVGLAERAFADGYYVMVEPLASGTTSTFTFGGGASEFGFSTKVTATITSIPVPEPDSSHSLLGTGLSLVAWFSLVGRRKKKCTSNS